MRSSAAAAIQTIRFFLCACPTSKSKSWSMSLRVVAEIAQPFLRQSKIRQGEKNVMVNWSNLKNASISGALFTFSAALCQRCAPWNAFVCNKQNPDHLVATLLDYLYISSTHWTQNDEVAVWKIVRCNGISYFEIFTFPHFLTLWLWEC